MTDPVPILANDPIFDRERPAPVDGIGLALSGGGYRAMLFHVGTLWRLLDSGKLGTVTRVSSVSGGSITAGVLALAWEAIEAGGLPAFRDRVVDPLRALARVSIDERAILGGIVLPGSIAHHVARAYDRHLFDGATLQALPDTPRFVINATNLETGALFRFSKRYMRDYRIGQVTNPTLPLSHAVAASSAFPPVLSPFVLDVAPDDFAPIAPDELADDAFRNEISLADGGVYDNLGLQQVWPQCKTVLASDAGARLGFDPAPPGDWARQALRVLEVIDHQVRNLRTSQMVGSIASKERSGAYWSIRSDIAIFPAPGALPCPPAQTTRLAATPTRLRRLDERHQERLINWGYAVTDAALRHWWDATIPPPQGFPYPNSGVGQ